MKKLLPFLLVIACIIAFTSCGGEISSTTRPKHYHTISEDFVMAKEPQCGSAGYMHRLCETCGEPVEYKDIPATGFHVYTDWIEIQSGGCSAVSYRAQICEQCGHTVVDAPEGVDVVHPHEFELIMEEATCTLPGIEYRFECKNCHFVAAEKISEPLGHLLRGKGYKKLDALFHTQECARCGEDVMEAHSLDSLKIIDGPSCNFDGSAEGTCDKCGESGEIMIPAMGHLYFGEAEANDEATHTRHCINCDAYIIEEHTVLLWHTVEEATCYQNGLDEGVCAVCLGEATRATDTYHDYEAISYDSGSCTEGGSVTYECSMCKNTITLNYLASGHIYRRVRIVAEPTCDKQGVGIKKCISCGEEKEYTISALGHKYSNGVTIRLPGCHRDGLVEFTCQREGCSHVSEVILPRYHNFDGGVITVSPTCESEGEIVYTCKSCGESEKYTIPICHDLTYHEYVAPTCTTGGQAAYYTCNDCDRYFSKYYSYRVYLEYKDRYYFDNYHATTRYIETTYEKTLLEPLGHSYTSYYNSYDKEDHYRRCVNGCGSIVDRQPHELINCFEIYTERDSSGYIYYIRSRVDCTVCGYYAYGKLDVDYEGIGAGHIVPCDPVEVLHEHSTYEVIPMVFPTCTEEGLTPGLLCGECGKVLYEQETIPAFGHDFVDEICRRCGVRASSGLEFRLNSDGQSYSVVGIGTCTDTDLVIPDTYEDLPVTKIGRYAFSYCTSLTSVVIPNSVTSIDFMAFEYCISLTSIEIPDSVTSMGTYLFRGCTSLVSIVIPNSVRILYGVTFSGCTALTSIEVDEDNEYYCSIDGNLYTKDVTYLMKYAPGKTDTSFTFPDSVTNLGEEVFSDCNSLTNIVVPNSVTCIPYGVFMNCTSLTSIVIPESVNLIGDSFLDCPSLISIEVDENNEYYKSIDGNLYSKDGKTLVQYATGKKDILFAVPDFVTSIGRYAFGYCTYLTSVVIPDSVTSIDNYAFYECRSLERVVIPNSVTNIGDSAFAWCYNLTIYCESESQPDGWNSKWNSSNRPVVWGYKGE